MQKGVGVKQSMSKDKRIKRRKGTPCKSHGEFSLICVPEDSAMGKYSKNPLNNGLDCRTTVSMTK